MLLLLTFIEAHIAVLFGLATGSAIALAVIVKIQANRIDYLEDELALKSERIGLLNKRIEDVTKSTANVEDLLEEFTRYYNSIFESLLEDGMISNTHRTIIMSSKMFVSRFKERFLDRWKENRK